MTTGFIIDRRQSGGNKSIPNRERFMNRYHRRIAAGVKAMISGGSIGTIFDDVKRISIPVGDLSEPHPSYSSGEGRVDLIVTGNVQYRVGDLIPKQGEGNGQGNGSGAGNGGDSEDDFSFTLTREEFLHYFFEDLELPNLLNKDISVTEEYRTRKAGYSASGTPSNLSILRTMRESTGRRVALRASKKRKLKELERELSELEDLIASGSEGQGFDVTQAAVRCEEIREEIVALKKAVKKVPFVDDIDLRYRNTIREAVPTTKAVMFCLMDVSGSMTQWHKDIAKRYFMLLFLFLNRRYEKVELVFVRHTTEAEEVDEQEFFYGRRSGGTQVSAGLEKIDEIIQERYDRKRHNIYIAQASDGDNWGDDGSRVVEIMKNSLLPKVQYHFYVEISPHGQSNDLWDTYQTLAAQNFSAAKVTDPSEIFQVFRRMFGGGDKEPA